MQRTSRIFTMRELGDAVNTHAQQLRDRAAAEQHFQDLSSGLDRQREYQKRQAESIRLIKRSLTAASDWR